MRSTRGKGRELERKAVWSVLLGVLSSVAISVGTAAAQQPCASNETLRVGPSAALPDCRAYEQVSPTEKGGFAAYSTQGTPAQAAPGGKVEGEAAVAYLNNQAFPGAAGNSALFSAHLSRRTDAGWQTTELTPGVPTAHVLSTYFLSYDFSEDLSQTVIRAPLVPLTPEATPGVFNLFHRHADGAYTLVNSLQPTVSAEEQCPPFLSPICFFIADISTFAGASSDFSHVLFESTAQFFPEAPETGREALYENVAGQVSLVGVLPDGHAAVESTAGAGSAVANTSGNQASDRRVERAISQDGSQVVFQAPADGGQPDPSQTEENIEVYDRVEGKETIELSAPAADATPGATPESATFWAASSDGSRVFFTSTAELTATSNTGEANSGEDLYEYSFDRAREGKPALKDLTVDSNPLDTATGAAVQGVVDVSRDGSYLYFVAQGQLVEGEGVDGQPNLYVEHDGGTPVFITTLSSSGSCEFNARSSADSCVWTPFPAERESYVTPDGQHMAFMSTNSIATTNFPGGYDNTDQGTGEADTEVYEYSAPTAQEEEHHESGRLVCASCEASGARPVGNALMGGITQVEQAVAGTQPFHGTSTPFYRVRALSDNGTRLFYTSPAPLAGSSDRVYEYEQGGTGSCSSAAGCTFLISSRGGRESDRYLDASANGDDVFFATPSALVRSDEDTVADVYDARVGGGFASPSPEAPCVGSCRLPSPPGAAGPPLASGAIGPSGNLPPVSVSKKIAAKPKKCRKRHRRRHGRCVKVKKSKRPTAKRANGNRRAGA